MSHHLKEVLKSRISSYITDYITMRLSKRELKTLSEEELGLVKDFITGFYRGRYRIHPKSLEHFLSSSKYEESCVAELSTTLDELIKRGILRMVDEGGKTYWYIYDEKLDPLTYKRLYLKEQETFKTLLTHLGLAEFMEKFAVERCYYHSSNIFTFKYEGLIFTVSADSDLEMSVRENIGKPVTVEGGESSTRLPPVHLEFHITKPSVEDVYRVVEMVRKFEDDVNSKIERILNWVNDYVGDVRKDVFASGWIKIRDYRVVTYRINMDTVFDLDKRSHITFRVAYEYPSSLSISVSHTIGSRYLINAGRTLNIGDARWNDVSGTYSFNVDLSKSSITLTYSSDLNVDQELRNLPDISKEYNTIINMKQVLLEVFRKRLKDIEGDEVITYNRYGERRLYSTVGDLLREVGWRDGQSVEESILKIWLIKIILSNFRYGYNTLKEVRPDIISVLVSLTYLNGAPYDYVLERVNRGFEYVIDLARKGRLKITENDVLLDGKPTGIKLQDRQRNNVTSEFGVYMYETRLRTLFEIISLLSTDETSVTTKPLRTTTFIR